MSAMNWLEIELVTNELKFLEGAILNRCYQPDKLELIFELRKNHHNFFLFVSFAPQVCRLHLLSQKRKSPRIPYAFVSQLRSQLEPSKLNAIKQIKSERIVTLNFETPDGKKFSLLMELMDQHANAFLLDAGQTVLGSLKKDSSKKRALAVGKTFVFPEVMVLKNQPEVSFDTEISFDTNVSGDTQVSDEAQDGEFPYNKAAEFVLGELAAQLLRERKFVQTKAAINQRQKKMKRTHASLERSFEKTFEAPMLRLKADLLQINFAKLKAGTKEVTLKNIIGDGDEITIKLDPAKSVQLNINLYYKRAKKLERGLSQIENRILETEEEQDRLSRLLELLEDNSDAAIQKVRNALGLKQETRDQTKAQKQKYKAPPYRRFFAANGAEIRVGRSAKENDVITFGMSKGDDFWFHASGYAGSHVVVPMKKGEQIDQETLLDAACLAAHYSKVKGEAIEVCYTRIRYIRKPAKRQAGQVIFSKHKSIYSRAEPERIRRLMDDSKLGGASG